jgi:Uri superfamily endonuclease
MNRHDLGNGNQWQRNQETDSGAYQLFLLLERPIIIEVGALGSHTFPSGTYIYTGRASRGLSKRIGRHLRQEKRRRWHIDYLVEHAQIGGIRVYPGKASEECSINDETALTLHGIFPVRGFGSSDCRCTSHLILIADTHTERLKAMNWSKPPQRIPKEFTGSGYEP